MINHILRISLLTFTLLAWPALYISCLSQSIYNESIINRYSRIISLQNLNNKDPDSIRVSDPGLFNPGDYVLFIVMKGAEIYTSENLPDIPELWGKVLNMYKTGLYSIHSVSGVNGDTILLSSILPTAKPLRTGEVAQLIGVPFVKHAIVNTTLTCKSWNPADGTGGVIALMASQKIEMNGNIDVSGKGFRGADPGNDQFTGNCSETRDSFYTEMSAGIAGLKGEGIVYEGFHLNRGILYASNGGGGGNGRYSGGGGGGNFGLGGTGGKENSICKPAENLGGIGHYIPLGFFTNTGPNRNHIFMGGGGGTGTQDPVEGRYASRGGNGGGIVILITDSLVTKGHDTIRTNGENVAQPATAGAGGGGAGGTIVLGINKYIGNLHLSARGGNGGNTNAADTTGPGGFGGGGFIWHSEEELPKNVTINVTYGKVGRYLPTGTLWGAITSTPATGSRLGDLVIPYTESLFNSLADKYVYCSVVIEEPLPATAPKGGNGIYSFIWQKSIDKMTWSDADGNYTGQDYIPPASNDTVWFRRIITSGLATDTSNIIQVVQLPPIVNNQVIGGATLCEGQIPDPITQNENSLEGGTGQYHFLWEISGSQGFSPAPGINNTISYTPLRLNTFTRFRRIVTSDACFTLSNEVHYDIIEFPEITKEPASDTIYTGGTGFFSIKAAGSEPLTFAWYFNTSPIAGAIETMLAIPDAEPANSGLYYCTVTNECSSITSDSVFLYVIPPVVNAATGQKIHSNVYPNPASDKVFVDFSGNIPDRLILTDIRGNMILSALNSASLDVRHIPEGIYLLRIYFRNNEQGVIQTLVVRR